MKCTFATETKISESFKNETKQILSENRQRIRINKSQFHAKLQGCVLHCSSETPHWDIETSVELCQYRKCKFGASLIQYAVPKLEDIQANKRNTKDDVGPSFVAAAHELPPAKSMF